LKFLLGEAAFADLSVSKNIDLSMHIPPPSYSQVACAPAVVYGNRSGFLCSACGKADYL